MCRCTPNTAPFCGKPGCEFVLAPPERSLVTNVLTYRSTGDRIAALPPAPYVAPDTDPA